MLGWLWVLGCSLTPTPLEYSDRGCACLDASALKVHLACVDCLDAVKVDFQCSAILEDRRLVVHASARIDGPCPNDGSCAPLVGICHDVPELTEGAWVLAYGEAEVSVMVPLPTSPVCACPGSMTPR